MEEEVDLVEAKLFVLWAFTSTLRRKSKKKGYEERKRRSSTRKAKSPLRRREKKLALTDRLIRALAHCKEKKVPRGEAGGTRTAWGKRRRPASGFRKRVLPP